MMNKAELTEKITNANIAYRAGTPVMSDEEFDALLEQFQSAYPDEYDCFRDSLNESSVETGPKIKHRWCAGSLDKLKYEEPTNVKKFLDKAIKHSLSISAKIDGLSGIAKYANGKLVSFATRGDGYVGTDITAKAAYVKNLPQTIPVDTETYVRGELVILKKDYANVDGTAARNIVSGLINRKEWDKTEMGNVSFIAYAILGPDFTKTEQFSIIEKWKFTPAWHCELPISEFQQNTAAETAEMLLEYASQDFEYQTDGLVISDSEYRNEDEYRPAMQKAFKMNMQRFETRLIDVDFRGPHKDGGFTPVGILEPTEIDDVVVSQCTLHNLDFIAEKGVKLGSYVSILRSGDVIPKLVSVISSDEHCRDIIPPATCPCCGSTLVRDGINVACPNQQCPDRTRHQVMHFIRKLGVKTVSYKSLENFGISTFEDLVAFKPDPKKKSHMKFMDEMLNKVYSQSPEDLMCAMNFKGVGETLLRKIFDFYGFESLTKSFKTGQLSEFIASQTELPSGIGFATLEAFTADLPEASRCLDIVLNDTKYVGKSVSRSVQKASGEIKGYIVVTGTLAYGSRNRFLEFAKSKGWESKSGVSKGVTYLINNDINSTSSKNRKAKELGINIISEKYFLENVIGKDEKSAIIDM